MNDGKKLPESCAKRVVSSESSVQQELSTRTFTGSRNRSSGTRSAPCAQIPASPMQMAENRMEPTLVRKKMTRTLVPEAPNSFSRSDRVRPLITSGASPRTKKRYTQAAPMPAAPSSCESWTAMHGARKLRTRQHNERSWVGEHADHQHREYPYEIVDFEIVYVLAHARGGLRWASD